jgi:acyl-CoA synthetase (AMP-forming)/AMP-acid ligase II/short-subunit dehydrogenase
MGQDGGVHRFRHWLRIAAGVTGRGPGERRLRAAVAGRTVLVTGASEGIGAATARRLGRAGATVLLVARTRERLDAVRAEIEAAGGTAHVHVADLSRPPEAAALGAELLRRYRRIDVVVSNAGRSIRRPVAETADRFHDVERTVAVNYLGPVQLLLALLPALRTTGGHVVNVSTAGLAMPAAHWSAYLASKAAFDTWLRSAAVELRADGVTVSTVYCGLVRTRMSAPTARYDRLPAMSSDEAAAVVCRAVAYPHRWWPWWVRPGAVIAAALPGAVEWVQSVALRMADPVRVIRAIGPIRLPRMVIAGRRYGPTLAAAVAAGPRAGVALVDREGPMSRAELTRAVAAAAGSLGVRAGERVAVACSGHRGFVATVAAVTHLGADAVLVPPDTPRDRLAELLTRERVTLAVHDEELAGLFAGLVPARAWPGLLAGTGPAPPRARRPGRLVVLTSGSTGTPRAVTRRLPVRTLLGPVTTHLRLIPVRPGEPIAVAAPPHHGYGLTYLAAGLTLGAPVVLVAGEGPREILAAVAERRATVLCALPVQLRRIAELEVAAPASLHAVVSGAAPLPADLAERLRGFFGERVFNLYGTTEAGWAAIATPHDLRTAPGTVGRAPRGIRLLVLDPAGEPVPPGELGEVHVEGWQADRVATGDRGHLDPVGRLFLHGRMDDMIVSGGENVYPAPVAATLATHPDVDDAVLAPVPDAEFGQRLRAWVQVRPGSALTEAALREWLRGRLSRAEQPRDIELVAELPRTASGKPVSPGGTGRTHSSGPMFT